MQRKMKRLSVLLVLVFMLQSILMPAVYAQESNEVVMEITIPQLTLTNARVSSDSFELVWASNDSSIKASTYDVYRDNSLIKTVEGFTYTDGGLSPQTKYTYAVKAKNANGEVISESNTLSVTTAAEVIKPDRSQKLTDAAISIEKPEPANNGEILKVGNPDFKTDRFIIKYKNEASKKSARKVLENIDNRSDIFDKDFKMLLKESKQNKGIRAFNDSLQSSEVISSEAKNNGAVEIVPLNEDKTLEEFSTVLEKNNMADSIEYIQPDYQLSLSSEDPYYGNQWGLKNTSGEAKTNIDETVTDSALKIQTGSQKAYLCDAGVPEAWEKTTGKGVIVAVIDTGLDTTHEDLSENIWVNEKEIPGNGIDDDGNGKIDDVNGWNFSDNSNVVCDNTNLAGENHGTHLAGIISAAKDNQKGIAGVAPSAKVMPLKVFVNGKAYTSDVINAIQYAESMGVKIVNCSWGSTDDNLALKEAIQKSGMLFVCAAGNNGSDIDNSPVYPAAFDCPNIITVASINKNGSLSSFSDFGQNSVDVAAPGEGIYSTFAGNKYGENSGTSMAAAFVSGEAALLLSYSGSMSATELKERIVKYSEHLSSLTGKVNNSAKINCINSINNIISDMIYLTEENTGTQNVTGSAITVTGAAISLYSSGSGVLTAFEQQWNTQPYESNNTSVISNSDGILKLKSTTADPFIHMYYTGSYDPNTYRYIEIRYRMDAGTPGTGFQIYYLSTENAAMSEAQVVNSGSLIADGQWHVYHLDMWKSAKYKTGGNITGWRYDWATNVNVTMDLDYIKLVKEPSAFEQQWDTQPYESNNTSVISNSEGILKLKSTTADPFIHMYYTGSYDPNAYRYIEIRYKMAAGTPGTGFQIYYLSTDNVILSEEQVVNSGSLIADGQWHVYYLDMWSSSKYRTGGNITGWRYDWATNVNVTMELDYIKLVKEPVAFEQEWDTQPYESNNTSVVSNEGGILKLKSITGDPFIHMYYTGSYDPNTYRYMEIRYKMAAGTPRTAFQIYYLSTENVVMSEEQDIISNELIADGQWHIYYMDMWSNSKYRTGGNITGWRYDWATNTGVTMELDYIRLVANGVIAISPMGPNVSADGAPNKNISFKVYANNVPIGTSRVLFPIWTSKNGQDDLKWYEGKYTGNNCWEATIYKTEHNNESGEYLIHVYADDLDGNRRYLTGTSVTYSFTPYISLVLKIKNVKSFSNRTFTITYNPSDISEVIDLCKLTYKPETTTGTIAGTGITILKNEPGTIVFSVDKNIPENKSWSGVLNIFEFKPAISGQVTFNCKVE